ncbi:MAG: ABC transporter permease [Anaerolineae bacterium]|nr:ABC transporter permease [Anaerolineae bacterium]
MLGTRTRKIARDIMSRKGRTLLVVLSILIGVFGATTMISMTDLLSRQMDQDLKPEEIAHLHIYVRSTGGTITPEENRATLDCLSALEGVVDVEGQAVYAVGWREAGDTGRFRDGVMVASTEPIGQADLEPVARATQGRYPQPGRREIAVEQRFAEAHGIRLGNRLVFDQGGVATTEWTVVGFVLHPYWIMEPATQDQIQASNAIYATYEDAQQIAGFSGLTAIYARYVATDTSRAGMDAMIAAISSQTPYVAMFTVLDDPENNYLLTLMHQIGSALNMLGILSMIVPGFLVANIINSVVVEQKKQIGTLKSLGATLWDNFVIYAGMALAYGLAGTIIGLLLAVPVAAIMARQVALLAFSYIDGFRVSPTGVLLGAAMGLVVPVLAALIPVLRGMRVSILEAMTDLGIASTWGRSRLSRWMGRLPFPITVVQALSHVYQQKGRLALTGLTLTLAAASFMGVTAVYNALDGYISSLTDSFNYEITVTPQGALDPAAFSDLFAGSGEDIEAIYSGYNVSVGVKDFQSSDPLTAGSNQVSATGIDPARPALRFDLQDGTGWQDDPVREGVIISRSLAENLSKGAGDTLALLVGQQVVEYPILGVNNQGFDALYMDWRVLARLAGYVDAGGDPLVGVFYVNLKGHPSVEAVDESIARLSDVLRGQGVEVALVNQVQVAENQAQQAGMFGVFFNLASAVMAVVGAIGLTATLSMAVYERQKEIGVMRSIGAGSLTIMSQFLLEGILVGLAAWMVAVPLSVGLGAGLMDVLPFDYLGYCYPPYVFGLGLAGILIVATVASLWPSLVASRKTVSEILRYQ